MSLIITCLMSSPENKKSLIKNEEKSYDGVVFNQYKIIKLIGSGGMGNVYLAKRNDGQFNKDVAIKILSKGYNNKSYKDRFLREKQILAQLRHPNIVPLLDAGETEDGIPWFVLEYIEGGIINKFCKSQFLSLDGIVNLIIKICDAIAFAHSKGIIHRDIKHHNIIIENIDGKYQPIILDFGIAHKKDKQNLTNQGSMIGSPGYMSPEQMIGINTIDRRTDIYSLGVVMYELFAQKKLFKGKSILDMHKQTILDLPIKISKIIPSFPKDLQTIVETCLKKKPEDRYQSMSKLKEDLHRWMNGDSIIAHKESWLQVLWRSIKRNKVITALVTTIILISLVSIAKYTYDINKERHIAVNATTESDDLFNYLLKDLYGELTEIGRVNLLQSVAEKNLQHLNKYHFKQTTAKQIKYAKAYRNIAKVLEIKNDNSLSIDAQLKAKNIIESLLKTQSSNQELIHMNVLIHSDLGSLYLNNGQLQLSNDEHQRAQKLVLKLKQLNSTYAKEAIWKASTSYAWTLMEQSNYDLALLRAVPHY